MFNALHGRFGEDGRVQGLLDHLAIPYTHSGVLASALAMDKPMAKRVFASAGLRCPEGVETTLAALLADPPIEPPFVVKPAAEGSSVGVVIVLDDDLRPLTDRNDVDPECRLLVERYIPGRELTCGVLGDEPLAVTEIRPNNGFYDYRAKYTEGFAIASGAGAAVARAVRAGAGGGACGAPRAWLPWRQPRPISASTRRKGPTALSARGEHPAGHDAAVAGPGAGGLSWHRLSQISSFVWWSGPDATCDPYRPAGAGPAPAVSRRPGCGRCDCGGWRWPWLAWVFSAGPPMRCGIRQR